MNNNKFHILPLEWDSNFFQNTVGKMQLRGQWNDAELISFLKKSKNSYKLIYLFLENELALSNAVVEEFAMCKVDCKVLFHLSLINLKLNGKQEEIKSYSGENANTNLIELAIEAGHNSRFSLDKNIPESKFRELYTVWIQKSVKKINAEDVLVYEHNGQIEGMVTWSKKDNVATIGLIAVSEAFRNRSIGKFLVNAVAMAALNKFCTSLEVNTQLENHMAMRFYSRYGFEAIKKENIYHLWNL